MLYKGVFDLKLSLTRARSTRRIHRLNLQRKKERRWIHRLVRARVKTNLANDTPEAKRGNNQRQKSSWADRNWGGGKLVASNFLNPQNKTPFWAQKSTFWWTYLNIDVDDLHPDSGDTKNNTNDDENHIE